MREQAKLVDSLGIVAVSDGTDEDQLCALRPWLCGRVEHLCEGAEDEVVVLLRSELGDVEECFPSRDGFGPFEMYGFFYFFHGDGWEENFDCVGLSTLGTIWSP